MMLKPIEVSRSMRRRQYTLRFRPSGSSDARCARVEPRLRVHPEHAVHVDDEADTGFGRERVGQHGARGLNEGVHQVIVHDGEQHLRRVVDVLENGREVDEVRQLELPRPLLEGAEAVARHERHAGRAGLLPGLGQRQCLLHAGRDQDDELRHRSLSCCYRAPETGSGAVDGSAAASGATPRNTTRTSGGVTSVDTKIARRSDGKSWSSKSPRAKPIEAMMRPTSPREIMHTPTRSASSRLKPPSSAPAPLPTTLVRMLATMTGPANGSATSLSWKKSVTSPMLTKKMGTRKA